MKELFFSLVSEKLFITLLEDNKVIKTICEDNHRKHSENFILKIREIFNNAAFSVSDLSKIFFLTGPGGQTGERISLSFVLGSLLNNPLLKTFSMDSLTFQATVSGSCLSVVSTGERSKWYHLAVYQDKKVLFKKEKIDEEEFRKVRELFINLPLMIDFKETDFLHSFFLHREEFKAFGNELV